MFLSCLPYSGSFTTSMGAHFAAVDLDNTIQFSTLSRMSGFLWHSSKQACRFSCFRRYKSRFEVLACSLNTNLNHVIIMLQLRPSLIHYVKLQQLLGERYSNFLAVFLDRYVIPAALSPGPEALCGISSKMPKFHSLDP